MSNHWLIPEGVVPNIPDGVLLDVVQHDGTLIEAIDSGVVDWEGVEKFRISDKEETYHLRMAKESDVTAPIADALRIDLTWDDLKESQS